MTAEKILLVGCGAMGGALRQGWQHKDLDVTVISPHSAAEHNAFSSPKELPQDFQPDVVVFAIKPQIAVSVLPYYKRFSTAKTFFVSIMAGISVEKMQQLLGNEAMIIRAMPNLPVLVREGATGIYSSVILDAKTKQSITGVFSGVGCVVWVESENLLNNVTAISGSGPAYFFRLVEAMAKAGERLGLPKNIASQLAEQTLVGAGALLAASQESATHLRTRVTSPGGTTAAALEALDADDALGNLAYQAVSSAVRRAEELS